MFTKYELLHLQVIMAASTGDDSMHEKIKQKIADELERQGFGCRPRRIRESVMVEDERLDVSNELQSLAS